MKRIDVFETKKVLKIGQRVEISKIGDVDDEQSEVYTSRVEDIKNDDVFLALPMDSMLRPVIPRAGQIIEGRIIEQNHIYSFTARYGHMDKKIIPVWKLTMNATVVKSQNREFVRIPAVVALKISVAAKDGSLGVPFRTDSVDMSGNGVSFLSAEPFPLGTILTVETTPIPSVGRIHTFVEVKRCAFLKNGEKYLIGGRFTDLSKAIQNRLVKYLFSKQRELINKGIISK
ncbi:flagellar brake protein [Pectinatus haikarae]|uniref:C-di-GMP-binding flagellar brake protein YcgR n=1 Tax=Pectinatus haikarae TaxID=349096 RepID=A0ABT9Y9H6_9FIRM|nr:flagellar brake domain-containing protein [Pectinatus haikarae]MDQ0203759.1 c-di-GMP-binding flagellar brake protein YcgR [Pectinatus haikarae]